MVEGNTVVNMFAEVPIVKYWALWVTQDIIAFAVLVVLSILIAFLLGFKQGSPLS